MNMCMILMALTAYQRGGQPVLEERFKVEYVLLDISVTTKKGALVTDLKASDFVVSENKEKVKVTFFEILDYRDVIKSGSEQISSETEIRTQSEVKPTRPVQQIIIALDFESVALRDINKAFQQLEQFLDSLDNTFTYKINLYALDRGSLTKGFTDQLSEVKSALAVFRDGFVENRNRYGAFDSDVPMLGGSRRSQGSLQTRGRRSGSGSGSALTSDSNDFIDLEKGLEECLSYGAPQRGRGGACDCMSETLSHFMEEHKYRSERVMGELEILTYKFEQNKDLKTMMVLSPGFVLYRLNSAMQLFDFYARQLGCTSGMRVSPLSGRLDLDTDFKRVVHACIKNRVVFHTFDIFNGNKANTRAFSAQHRGRPAGAINQAYRDYDRQVTQGLRELARESGGTFRQVFRLKGSLNRAIEENRFYYVLGYVSPRGGKDFRKIKVKVKRKKTVVRHRRGYFGN